MEKEARITIAGQSNQTSIQYSVFLAALWSARRRAEMGTKWCIKPDGDGNSVLLCQFVSWWPAAVISARTIFDFCGRHPPIGLCNYKRITGGKEGCLDGFGQAVDRRLTGTVCVWHKKGQRRWESLWSDNEWIFKLMASLAPKLEERAPRERTR